MTYAAIRVETQYRAAGRILRFAGSQALKRPVSRGRLAFSVPLNVPVIAAFWERG
jgi:hypothetical protein